MTDREKLINQISGILLAHDCLTDEIQGEIFLALDLYEIRKRSTEIVPADPMDNEAMIRDFAAAKAVAGRSPKSVRQYVLALNRARFELEKRVPAAPVRGCCGNCGIQIETDWIFCANCGREIKK